MRSDAPLLQLGRLDGRLTHSPARDPWLIRARLAGAAISACNAGVPVSADDIEAWVAGSRPPPRAREGLNDPLSVAAIVHFFFAGIADNTDGTKQQAGRLIRNLFDAPGQAREWASDDVLHYGPLWRALAKEAAMPGLEPSLRSIAERLTLMARLAERTKGRTVVVATSVSGERVEFAPDDPKAWLVLLFVPTLLRNAKLTVNLIPSLVPRHKFLGLTTDDYLDLLEGCVDREAGLALKSLEATERKVSRLRAETTRTARSRLAQAAELGIALPSISRRKLAIAMNATPAGAGYLLRQLRGHLDQ